MTGAVDDTGRGQIADRARTGMAWTGLSSAARVVIEFGTSVILARILLPGDFGIIAVAQAFLQLSYVVGNLGIGPAVIQARALSAVDRHAATTIAISTAAVLTLACILASPATAQFFAMPVLRRAMPLMSLDMLSSGLAAVPLALLRRELRYSRVVVVELGSAVVYTCTGVTLALLGHGLWALVWAPLVAGWWTLAVSHVMARYRPGLSLDRVAMRRFLGFGSLLTAKNALLQVARNGDNLVVAKVLGEGPAGLYTRAFSLSTMPQSRVMNLIYGVAFPVFCRVRNDRPLFHSWYLKATAVAAVVMTPLLLGLAMVSGDLVVVVYGEPWRDMAPCLQLLCVAALVNSLHTLGGAAIEASGQLRYELGAQALYGALVPVAALVGTLWGISGVGCGVLLAAVAFYLAKAWVLRQAIGLPIRDFVRAPAGPLAAGVVMCLALSLMRVVVGGHDLWSRPPFILVVLVSTGAVVYLLAIPLLARRELTLLLDQWAAFRSRSKGGAAEPAPIAQAVEDR